MQAAQIGLIGTLTGRLTPPGRASPVVRIAADGGSRRNLVIAGRSGERPYTIRFADLRYRALPALGLLSSRATPSQAA